MHEALCGWRGIYDSDGKLLSGEDITPTCRLLRILADSYMQIKPGAKCELPTIPTGLCPIVIFHNGPLASNFDKAFSDYEVAVARQKESALKG